LDHDEEDRQDADEDALVSEKIDISSIERISRQPRDASAVPEGPDAAPGGPATGQATNGVGPSGCTTSITVAHAGLPKQAKKRKGTKGAVSGEQMQDEEMKSGGSDSELLGLVNTLQTGVGQDGDVSPAHDDVTPLEKTKTKRKRAVSKASVSKDAQTTESGKKRKSRLR
jgi:hypothetical protein